MKNLLYKELKLVVHPFYYFVTLTGALLLIPQWPYFVAMMYLFFITVPNLFTSAKASNDVGFTVMLPVRKSDVVKARLYAIGLLEVLQVAVAVPFAALNNVMYPAGNFLMDANIAFLGMTLVMYGLFNAVFFPMFYKTGYKMGIPLLAALVACTLFCTAVEVFAALPWAKPVLEGVSGAALVRQIPVLAGSIVAFVLLNLLAFRLAARRFERVDL